MDDFVHLKWNFIRLFEESDNFNCINLFLDIFITIERTCCDGLKDVQEEIKNDSKSVPTNGNIHSITTETLTFIENLLPYDIIAGTTRFI